MATQPSAPPVVAVVVTCDPGPWFEEALHSLESQDYPNLSVLVIDSASLIDPTERVAAMGSDAFVRRLDQRVGFGVAANDVLAVVEGASHFLFCHDDVVFAPDSVRLLVEEAYRSNAGIVSPKVLEWDRPERLAAVGIGADKVGAVHPMVDAGELDQEQHDAVRDVFVAPSGATLVRSDLFSTLGGFSAEVDQFGEDLDLSWRAQVAGARVIVAPAAAVRHLGAVTKGIRPGWTSGAARRRAAALTEQHRLRTLVTCYGLVHLLWILPLAVIFLLGEATTLLFRGQAADAWATVAVLPRAFRRPGRLWAARRQTQRHRAVRDGEIRRFQSRGNARLRAFLRARVDGALGGGLLLEDPESAAATLVAPPDARPPRREDPGAAARLIGAGSWRIPVGAGVVLLILAAIGTRSLWGSDLPAIGHIPVTSSGVGRWWQAWWSNWHTGGLGAVAPSAPALAILGVAGIVFFGAVGTLQHVLVLAPLAIGPFGAYRAARSWGSLRGRVAAMVVYATVPVASNALARGHWDGLVVYAAAPWVLAMLCRLSGEIPHPALRAGRIGGRVIGLGVLVALVGAFVPSFLFVVPILGIGLLAGSMLTGRAGPGVRLVAVAVAAAVIAMVLLAPWSADVMFSRTATFGVVQGASGRLSLGNALRFHTGPIGAGPLGWALLVTAALPLVIGRSWRLLWAIRLWMVALLCFGLTWGGLRGWFPVPSPEVLLAPAAAALAAAVALGVVAFELDLPGYRFGWRQLASTAAAIGAVVAAVPVLTGVGDGHLHLPSSDVTTAVAFLPDNHGGDYRVLWAGSPDALPMGSYYLSDGIGYATSWDGFPDVTDTWTTRYRGATPLLGADLRLASGALTTKLGHLLAPMAVRYVVVPNHNAPAGAGALPVASPAQLLSGLQQQTDLQAVTSDPNYTIYVNSAWAPARLVLPGSGGAGSGSVGAEETGDPRALQRYSLAGAKAVLPGRPDSGHGPVAAGRLYVSASRGSQWSVRVEGITVRPRPAFGWAMAFDVPAGISGTASLRSAPNRGLQAAQLVELALWLAAVFVVVADHRRRRSGGPDETVRPEWFMPMTPGAGRGQWRARADSRTGIADIDTDEVWERV